METGDAWCILGKESVCLASGDEGVPLEAEGWPSQMVTNKGLEYHAGVCLVL